MVLRHGPTAMAISGSLEAMAMGAIKMYYRILAISMNYGSSILPLALMANGH
jgi:hypothetical protein